ncbi:MAG TPA: transporter substrate-binding domain-containing protein [Dongiaceae bacterium]|nr:transporter substrate-binding domain-containing protein [Dongiaceae bacterium]
MEQTIRRRAFLRSMMGGTLAGFGAAGLLCSKSALAAEVVMLGIGDWPPYFAQDLKHNGIFAYIVTQAFAAVGYPVAYSYLPWKRALAEAQEGSLDGSPGWKATDERRVHFLFSDPVITSTSVLFHLKSMPFAWSTLDDLKGKRIGVTAGYSYGPDFDAAVADRRLTAETARDDATAFKMLLAKRTDIVVMNRDVGLDLLSRNLAPAEAALIGYDPKPVDEQPSCLAISKASPRATQLIADFNRGLAYIRDQGVLDQAKRDLAAGLFY